MKKLTREQFDNAAYWLKTHARPLERSIFEHTFEGGSAGPVIDELARFQNPDGGFGRALEPDMRSPTSSALATEMGLRILVELEITSDHPLARGAVRYVLDEIDTERLTWRVVPLDVNQFPHAPWWHDEAGSLARTFDDFLVIPRAGILAYLYHYAELVPPDLLATITQATLADVRGMDEGKFGGGGDALVYLSKLGGAPGLPEPLREELVQRVRELAVAVVAREPEQWLQYCAPPLKLAPTRDSITTPVLADYIPAHLDYMIGKQTTEGYWDVTWSWSDYPDVWEVAKAEWRGILILEALNSLESFDRIES